MKLRWILANKQRELLRKASRIALLLLLAARFVRSLRYVNVILLLLLLELSNYVVTYIDSLAQSYLYLILDCHCQVIKTEGWGGLYSGLKPSLVGTAASQVLYSRPCPFLKLTVLVLTVCLLPPRVFTTTFISFSKIRLRPLRLRVKPEDAGMVLLACFLGLLLQPLLGKHFLFHLNINLTWTKRI